jgi:lipoyl(octanoyl) transferase
VNATESTPLPCWLILPDAPVPYETANEAMHALAARRATGEIPDVLVLLEHPPVYTAGRTSRDEHMVWTPEHMQGMGAELHRIDRGGSFTFHGPGQLVGYPILQLDSRLDVIPHVRRMEDIVIRTGKDFGLTLTRSERQTGVWAGENKVCAIGVRLSRERVTLHGFGLNCATDRSWFEAIVPCGLADRGVTTLSEIAGRTIGVGDALPGIRRHFQDVFGRVLEPAPAEIIAMFAASTDEGSAATSAGRGETA